MTQLDQAPAAGGAGRFFYELREGARRQGNVIFALIFREFKSKSSGYGLVSFIGIILEPILGVVVLAFMFYLLKRQEVLGIHIALFLAVSYTPFMLFRRCVTAIPHALTSSRSFYAYQSVKPFDAVLARFIIELVLIFIGTCGLLFLLWWFMDLTIKRDQLLWAFILLATLLTGSFGLALMIGVYGKRFPIINKSIAMMGRGMLILSAVIHPMREVYSSEARTLVYWNPIAHYMELNRGALLGLQPYTEVSYGYFVSWAVISLFLGFVSYYVNRYKVLER